MIRVLRRVAVLATVLNVAAAVAQTATVEKLDSITHGPMLGQLTSHSVRVWARTRQPAVFRVIYSTREDLAEADTSDAVHTTWDTDATGWVELSDLKANTRYYYALKIDERIADTRVAGKLNSFTTLPSSNDYADAQLNPKGLFNFSFEIGTCNGQWRKAKMPPTYETMLHMLKDRIHFQIQNGDWIYEEGRDTTPAQWARANRVAALPSIVRLSPGITGVWENYRIYLEGSAEMAHFYREVPQFVTFDDHEILDDSVGSGEIGLHFDARGGAHDENVEAAVFRDPALAAWDHYVGWSNPDIGRYQRPVFGVAQLKKGSAVLFDPQVDFTRLDRNKISNLHVQWGHGNTGVYAVEEVLDAHRLKIYPPPAVSERARYSIGTHRYSRFRVGNAEFFLLDTRSYRRLNVLKGSADSETGMLGAAQEAWLSEGIKNSDADFFFIVSSVNVAVPHDNGRWYGGADDDKDDGWTAQLPQRERILRLAAAIEKPVIFLSGDLHKSFVARMAPGIYDIASGPHTSGNHRLGDAGGSPPSGWYDSGGRLVNMIWSSNQYRNDTGRTTRGWPVYTVVRVNNAYNIPHQDGRERWIAFPEPQIVLQFYDGYTAELLFAYAISTSEARRNPVPVPLERVKVLGGISVTHKQ